ncbi:MAG: tetratricopeptide repeat protein [Proteobacteria bacterium]|nr:tetratricopeptide repeat protein [Pseudomonadota bacterium]
MAGKAKTTIGSAKTPRRRHLSSRWEVGDLIQDRYEVYDIRSGGIGIVYVVYDHNHRIPYAIKTLQDRHLVNPTAVEGFIREAEVWVKMGRHQNIVRAVCVDRIDDRPYIFLECILGSNLKRILSGEPLNRRTALNYAIQFCRGMVHAQEQIRDFAHLDVKPENCMLTQDGILKVTDFSLSRALFAWHGASGDRRSTGRSGAAKNENLAGTFPYMSPEQFLDLEGADRHSDIYAFGVLLYEMLTGRRPLFARTGREWRDVHLKVTPVAPRTLVPSVSKELNDLTMSCLNKDPADRPDNFGVIAKSLEVILWEEFHEEIPSPTPEQLESWEYSNTGVSLCHLGRVTEAISFFDRALSKSSADPHAWLNKGVALGTLGDSAGEIECYERALAIIPEYAAAWYNKGLALYKLGRFEEAILCYDRSLAINPHQAEVWVNKGIALGGLGRSKEEVTCHERATVIQPSHVRAWVSKAAALMNLELFEEAKACCDKALTLAPRTAEAWVNKASALGALKRFDEAIHCCEKALAVDPHLCEAWICKGLALGGLGRFAEEARCYEKALDINPSYFEAWYRKGFALNNMGRFEEAISCYDQALEIKPKDIDAWVKKGLSLSAMSRFEEAVACFERALNIDSRHAEAWLNKGLTLRNLGSGSRGDRCIQRAVALDPTLLSLDP